jgi:hypothetical protein
MYFGFYAAVFQFDEPDSPDHRQSAWQRCSDNRHDDGNNIERDITGFYADSGKNQNTQPTCKSNTDTPKSGT